MMKRTITWAALVLCVILALVAGLLATGMHKSLKLVLSGKPNIVIVTLDACRADHLSCYGYHRTTSPNIDWLAENGVRFDQIITTSTSTKNALTSLLTALDFRYHKISRHDEILPDAFLTIAEALAGEGYRTCGFVANPHILEELNYSQGFDHFDDFIGSYDQESLSSYVAADEVMDEAIKFVRANKYRPFFLYVHLMEPHPPWQAPSPWLEGDEPLESFFGGTCAVIPRPEQLRDLTEKTRDNLVAKYDGAILFADRQIGRLIETLRRQGNLDNTIIVVSSDHGMEFMEHHTASHGYCPYDEVVRIPLVIYPGKAGRGPKTVSAMGRIYSIGSTVLALAGIPVPEMWGGGDMLSDSYEGEAYAVTAGSNCTSVRTPRYKLVYQDIRSKVSWYPKPPGWELYDLQQDPLERNNVIESNPEVARELGEVSEQYSDDVDNTEFIPGTMRPETAVISKEAEERLRALGYIQ